MKDNKATDLFAFVTGGAGYLGESICEALAESGFNLYIASRDKIKCSILAEKIKDQFGVNAVGLGIDIMDSQSVNTCFQKVSKEVPQLDVLVNNASSSPANVFEEMSDAEWESGLSGTVSSVFRCTKSFSPLLKKSQQASVINISSMYGHVSPNFDVYEDTGLDNPINYGAGKAGILQITRYLACYLAKHNIRVNTISPGAFPAEDVQKEYPKFIENLEKKIPLGRIGQPHEIKGVIRFLASIDSSYVTGSNIMIDGGWTAW